MDGHRGADTAATEGRTALLRALPDAVLICAADGTIREANDEAARLFGYAIEDLVGAPVEALVPVEHVVAHRGHRERYTATRHARPMMTGPGVEAIRADGSRLPVEVNLASVDVEGEWRVVASVRDVTEVRRTTRELRSSHELISGVLSAATEQAIVAVAMDGAIELFSAGAERMLGWSAPEVVGRPVSILSDPTAGLEDVWGLLPGAPLARRVPELVASGVAATRPWAFRTRSGERREVALSVTVRAGGDGPTGLIVVATDETARREQVARLARSEERFRRVFEDAAVGVLLLATDGRGVPVIVQGNASFAAMLGRDRRGLEGLAIPELTSPEDIAIVDAAVAALTAGSAETQRIQVRLLGADGSPVWVDAGLSLLGEPERDRDHIVVVLIDITAQRRAEAELRHGALHDHLTGLPNRARLTEVLDEAVHRARATGGGVGVLYVDIDDFKDVNDSLGHVAGDELLVEVARRLEGCVGDADVTGRMGSDEFVVVCPRARGVEDLVATAERVARAMAIRLPIGGEMVTVTASIGIAHALDGATDAGALLRQADGAMYRARAEGPGRIAVADEELRAAAVRHVELESELRSVLSSTGAGEHGSLLLDYQPCFGASTGAMVACEALVRWQHPRRGLLGPGEFLDVAEERSLMVPLGGWVLRSACREAAAWHRTWGARAPEVWVNVSAAQLGRHRMADLVGEVLADTGLPAEKLWLEITERQALSTGSATLDDLRALADLGVRLAVDDFGTGYAGLEYLRKLPVSGLKVDASYVAAIGTDPVGSALAATIVGLGRALGLTVVAEGIETAQQRVAVSDLGVDVLQGYLLARPGPADEVGRALRSGRRAAARTTIRGSHTSLYP